MPMSLWKMVAVLSAGSKNLSRSSGKIWSRTTGFTISICFLGACRLPPDGTCWQQVHTWNFFILFMGMEQAGITEKLSRQHATFKPTDQGVLEPLKLNYFYITMVGIVIGIFLAALTFTMEFICSKSPNMLCVKKIFHISNIR